MIDYITSSFKHAALSDHLGANILLWPDGDRVKQYGPPHHRLVGKSILMIEVKPDDGAFQVCNDPSATGPDMTV
jgi:hypothetical protein